MKKLLSIFVVLITFTSCTEYQKALKSEDIAVKYAAASKQYEKKKYDKAIRLFDQIAPSYKGKSNAERLFYMFAQSYYKTKQYYLAGYQFENFVVSYPKSEKVEEAAFLGAKSYSMLSPVYSLDQSDSEKAINKLQIVIATCADLKSEIVLYCFAFSKTFNSTLPFNSCIDLLASAK